MVAFDLAGGHIDRNGRGREKIIAGALVTHPRAAVAHPPEREVRLGVVIPGDPYGAAPGFPLISLRPRFATRLSRCRHCIDPPLFLAGVGIEGRYKSADSQFAA